MTKLSNEDLRRIDQHLADERYRLRREHDAGKWRARRLLLPVVSIMELICEHEAEQGGKTGEKSI